MKSLEQWRMDIERTNLDVMSWASNINSGGLKVTSIGFFVLLVSLTLGLYYMGMVTAARMFLILTCLQLFSNVVGLISKGWKILKIYLFKKKFS